MSNQNKNNLPPWYSGGNEPASGWIPSWNHVSMDSSNSTNSQQTQPSYQPQENPHWYPGQLETPTPESDPTRGDPAPSRPPVRDPSERQQQKRHEQLRQSQYYDQAFSRPPSANTAPESQFQQTPRSSSTMPSPRISSVTTQATPTKTDFTEAGPSGSSKQTGRKGGAGPLGKKRKRKSQAAAEVDDQLAPSPSEADKDKEKRTKTGRACDACRTKKIRCDILPSGDAPSGLDSQPICAHCKQSNLECTFFLPITETRFKKKRQTADKLQAPPADTQTLSNGVVTSGSSMQNQGSPDTYDYENMGGGATKSNDRSGGRVEGPTSIAFLLHTTIPTIPSEAFDLRHHNSWEVLEDGNGVIRVNAPPSAPLHADADPSDPTRAHNRLNKPILSGQTMSLLVNAYFSEVAPLFPIVSRAEFAAKTTPSPLMLYSICGLGATRRQFPREIFAGVRGVINGLLRSNDILSDAKFENVQALLLLAQVGDLHAQPTAATASASLIRTGAAIRMAQDLGLHRESALRAQGPQDLAYVELRRRVWATCVIMDRWYGAALGIPLLIDLLDCDVLLPAPYAISSLTEPSEWPLEPDFMALSEHLKLSILIGRVLKMIYSPTGLKHATDAQLAGLVSDMEKWKEQLPEELQFQGKESSHVAGLLHLGYTALQFLFWRVFMRITYSCPPHLTFCVEVSHWSKMIAWSRDALEWLDANDDALDTLFVFPYAATSCALIQYHTWARRGDSAALDTLKLVKETATRWEHAVQPDQMSIRRKTCETMTLLYEAALKTDPDSQENRMAHKLPANPTAGVIPRQGGFSKLQFKKDESMKGGGVFVAESEKERNLSGLNRGDVVLSSDIDSEQAQDLQDQAHDRVQTHDAQIAKADVLADQQASEGPHQDVSQAKDASGQDVLQIMPKGSYNVNPLINQDGSYSNTSMNLNQSDEGGMALGRGMMDITRQAQQYPMPNYPTQPDELQEYHFQQIPGSGGQGGKPEQPDTKIQTQTQHHHHQMYGGPGHGHGQEPGSAPQYHSDLPHEPHNNNKTNGYSNANPYHSSQQGQGHTGPPDNNNNSSGNFDPSFLDSLPVSTFDWESWTNYFDKFLPAANQNFETMQ
ncbi:hypothetical protein V865_005387 [Kwoniella europaea PYCC6329]|uniref:Zn(2)-C6 fungal-type domain-containing protein n=1 Tax=Kwoniella europaea PYCC6329 TaxID=1423913 RepID=A0AAX4KP00_9TREE